MSINEFKPSKNYTVSLDSMKTFDTLLLYSPIVVLWWVALWNIFEYTLNMLSNKNEFIKIIICYSIILFVLYIVYLIPDSLQHF